MMLLIKKINFSFIEKINRKINNVEGFSKEKSLYIQYDMITFNNKEFKKNERIMKNKMKESNLLFVLFFIIYFFVTKFIFVLNVEQFKKEKKMSEKILRKNLNEMKSNMKIFKDILLSSIYLIILVYLFFKILDLIVEYSGIKLIILFLLKKEIYDFNILYFLNDFILNDYLFLSNINVEEIIVKIFILGDILSIIVSFIIVYLIGFIRPEFNKNALLHFATLSALNIIANVKYLLTKTTIELLLIIFMNIKFKYKIKNNKKHKIIKILKNKIKIFNKIIQRKPLLILKI